MKAIKRYLVIASILAASFVICVLCGKVSGCRDVRRQPANKNQLLFNAILEGDTNQVASLLAAGVPANSYSSSFGHETALIDAVRFGNLANTRLLLEKGADPNLADRSGYAALFHLLDSPYLRGNPDNVGSDELVELLLAHGATPHGKGVTNAMQNIPPEDPHYAICQRLLKEIVPAK